MNRLVSHFAAGIAVLCRALYRKSVDGQAQFPKFGVEDFGTLYFAFVQIGALNSKW